MSNYCKYCDTLTNDFLKLYNEKHRLIWAGCFSCFEKQRPNLDWAFASSNLKELMEQGKIRREQIERS